MLGASVEEGEASVLHTSAGGGTGLLGTIQEICIL